MTPEVKASWKPTIGCGHSCILAKKQMKVGFWNVRTMYAAGKATQVASEMRRYGLQILGISKSRWIGSWRIRLLTGETVILILILILMQGLGEIITVLSM